ncbi:MAG: hypothetical protein WBM03_04460, partial [Steroidobacteraceae bacterium]
DATFQNPKWLSVGTDHPDCVGLEEEQFLEPPLDPNLSLTSEPVLFETVACGFHGMSGRDST